MKQLIVILLLSFSANAQTHEVPFPDSNAVWVQIKTKLYPPGDGPDEYCPFIIYSYDQSFENGMTYNNVYARPHTQGFDYLFDWVWNGFSLDTQIGRFRTDSLKVYYQNVPHSSIGCTEGPAYTGYSYDQNYYDEFLMYDFGLQVGDTFNLTNQHQVLLNSIDSVLIEGNYYRRFNFDHLSQFAGMTYYWIEGIGSKYGFFAFFYAFEQNLVFDCFKEDPDSSGLYPIFNYAHSNSGCQFVGIPESEIHSNKELLRIIDLMGRESEDKPNSTLIYIYSDGTMEKVYRME
jgi:hypothetical protein